MAGYQSHKHDDLVHDHEHIHITHHAKGGPGGQVEHLTSLHSHQHNHPSLEHAHPPHENFEREHSHEGHIHNHAHPAQSQR